MDNKRSGWLRGNMKGLVIDPFLINVFFFVLVIIMSIMIIIWIHARPYFVNAFASIQGNPQQGIQLGDSFFLNSSDTLIITFYFVFILALFISAADEGANPIATIVLGIFFLFITEVVTFGLSNTLYTYLISPSILSATVHLPTSLYIAENLPVLNAVVMFAYIVFVITRREGFQLPGLSNVVRS